MRLLEHPRVVNMASNNYLGLAGHGLLEKAALDALRRWGHGVASTRLLGGTVGIHKALEAELAEFLGMDAGMVFGSHFDALGGLFGALLEGGDAVVYDESCHPATLRGIRLGAARPLAYRHGDVEDLEHCLKRARAAGARHLTIATDGVFSMSGTVAPLREICDLADRHGALVAVDDAHGAGVLGRTGRGTPEHCGVRGRVDLLAGTLGTALGGASGGYVCGDAEMLRLLRQRAVTYLKANALSPGVCAAGLAAVRLAGRLPELHGKLHANKDLLSAELRRAGLDLPTAVHPALCVRVGGAEMTRRFAEGMLKRGVLVSGLRSPLVPEGQCRVRAQVTAEHLPGDLELTLSAFVEVREELGC